MSTAAVAIVEQQKIYTSRAVESLESVRTFDQTENIEAGFNLIQKEQSTVSILATGGVQLNIKLKFQGITTRPTGVQTSLPVKISLSEGTTKTENFTVDQGGVWSGIVALDNVPVETPLSIFVKGPFHIQKKICDVVPTETRPGIYACGQPKIVLKKGENDLNFSSILLLAGDLPPQDGVVDASDVAFIRQNIGTSDKDKIKKGDLNLDDAITTQDYSLILAALSVKVDDQIISEPETGENPTEIPTPSTPLRDVSASPTTKPKTSKKTPSSSKPKSSKPPANKSTPPSQNPPAAKQPAPPAGKGGSTCDTTLIPGSSNITRCCAGNPDLGLVNPELARRTQALLDAARAARVRLYVWSGFRTRENQAQCVRDTGGAGSAAPGTSMHEKGLAVDVDGDLNWAHANAGRFGLGFPISWDKWHMQMQ